MTQTEKAGRFQALHQQAGAFLILNPWDAGSARILAGLGFEAFATSSGAADWDESKFEITSKRRKGDVVGFDARPWPGSETPAELVAAGVKRISFASSLYRAAVTGLIEAASEAKQHGTFNYVERSLVTADLNRFLAE